MHNKVLIVLVLVILTPIIILAETHIPGGFIGGTWTLAGSPYIIEGNCVIPSESTLVIEPSVVVIFDPWCRLRCEGQLLAIGTETNPITFTAADTIQGSESIDFLNTDSSPRDSSRLIYCTILYGMASPPPDIYMHGGGLYFKNSSRVRISHCLITNCQTQVRYGANGSTQGFSGGPGESAITGNGGAIYCDNSDIMIEDCIIADCHTGNAIGGNGGNGDSDSQWEDPAYGGDGGDGGNATSGSGGALYLTNSSIILNNNIICNNRVGDAIAGSGGSGGNAFTWSMWYSATGGDGGDGAEARVGSGIICAIASSITMSNNLLYLNTPGNGHGGNGGYGGNAAGGGGAYPGTGGTGGNSYGANGFAVYADATSSVSLNSSTLTDHNNQSQGIGGFGGQNGNNGAFQPSGIGTNGQYLVFGINPSITNSIIWNNIDNGIYSNPAITYSDIQGGYPGIGNINLSPLFASVPIGDYFLSQTIAGQPVQSPCVDAGNPGSTMIIGTTRTDGIQDQGIVDMGFHYPLFVPAPYLVVIPLNLTFYQVWGANPPNQYLYISNSWIGTLAYTISENISWLSVTPMSGSAPPNATVTVSVNTTGLSPGTYTGEIIVSADGCYNAPQIISVTLNISYPLSGSLSGNLAANTYYAIGNLTIQPGDTLTIEPGTEIYFLGNYNFTIHGQLMAIGTEQDSIKFLHINPDSSWHGLDFTTFASNASILSYCLIKNSDSRGINCDHRGPTINHCLIANNKGGISGYYTDLTISDCTITDNIYPSSSDIYGGGIYLANSSSLVENCIIENNHASRGGGIFVDDSSIIKNCLVRGNTAGYRGGGINIYVGSSPTIINCTVVENGAPFGGGIDCWCYSTPTILNTIVAYTDSGGAVFFDHDLAPPDIRFCNFYDNGDSTFTGYTIPPGLGQSVKLNYNGDSCDANFNIMLDPEFIDPLAGDFQLQENSPCIDAGDPSSTHDPDGTITDMGAYYFDQSKPVDIIFLPDNFPVSIPASGGSFQYHVKINNNDTIDYVIDIFIAAILPNGTPYPILSRENINLLVSASIIRNNLVQNVPAGAPSGTYTYQALVRDHFTQELLDEDSFWFEKLSGDGKAKHDFGWSVIGWQ